MICTHINRTLLLTLVALILSLGCNGPSAPIVVVYTSVDQVYSEPILKHFAEISGVTVKPVFDVEAAKTTGLVQRLITEAGRPRADVFWNGEFAQTLMLAERGLLEAYRPSTSHDIPEAMKSSLWTAVGCRARVLLVNTNLVDDEVMPSTVAELLAPRFDSKRLGFANPLFGTTATHAAALAAIMGQHTASGFFQDLIDNGVHMADGNSSVRDLVASGRLHWGLTDTDDACQAINRGDPVRLVVPDQDGIGTLLIPGTVALINGATHPREAHVLIDYLVSKETEELLIASGCVQLSVRPGGKNAACLPDRPISAMDVDFNAVFAELESSRRSLLDIVHR